MKKYLLLAVAVLFSCVSFSQTFKTIFDQVAYVNAQWINQKDINASLNESVAKPLNEQQLLQLHLWETEKLLRKRKINGLSAEQQRARSTNLNTLHDYMVKGIFPVNDQHQNRQPYFIDKYNTYCAVGYLMKESGGDDIAKDIHATQNYSYLADITHSKLMDWVAKSGLTLDELGLIQPGYPGDWPCAFMEMHYNNTGTDVNEYLEIHESTAQASGMPPFEKALLYDENGNLYKTIFKADMQIMSVGYYYLFPSTDSFADRGKIILRSSASTFGSIDTISITTYTDTSVDVNDPNWYPLSIRNRHYSVGENENTPVGTSLTYCGFYGDSTWLLHSIAATIGYPNPCTVLPISLSNFSYSLINKKILLNWETLSESNTRSFTIERSTDGRNFNEIGKTPAAGNSSEKRKYTFTDNNPRYINHYRLKQLDADGKYVYSKILFVKVPQANPLEIIQPIVKNDLQVAIHLPQANISSLSLYDFSGRLMQKFKAIEGSQMLHLQSLSAGSYLLQLMTNEGKGYNQQLVK